MRRLLHVFALATVVSFGVSGSVSCSTARENDRLLDEIRESTVVPMLGSYDEEEQGRAIQKVLEALDRAPDGTAEILAAVFRDPTAQNRTKLVAAWLLAHIKDERAMPILIGYLGVDNDTAQDLVRTALMNYGSQAVPGISEALMSGDDVSRRTAAELLIDIENRSGFDALWRRYGKEPVAEIRFLLVCGFANDTRQVSERRLLAALEDRDQDVREYAWDALRQRVEAPDQLEYSSTADEPLRNRQIAAIELWLSNR